MNIHTQRKLIIISLTLTYCTRVKERRIYSQQTKTKQKKIQQKQSKIILGHNKRKLSSFNTNGGRVVHRCRGQIKRLLLWRLFCKYMFRFLMVCVKFLAFVSILSLHYRNLLIDTVLDCDLMMLREMLLQLLLLF